MIALGVLVCAVVLLELILFGMVTILKRDFQWLITRDDELPHLPPDALKKFIVTSFDPLLGWTRRPNSVGIEKGKDGPITFHIDGHGARQSAPHFERPLIASFGDSYTFCRQVNDDETWQARLSSKLSSGVMNFGVGNYGVDQAVLRYENTALPASIKVIILGFVPETICRAQSCWKHYLEFGNTFAFKARFELHEGQLALYPNPMQTAQDFSRLRELLPDIQAHDGFYQVKFRSFQYRFPYLFSFIRHPARNAHLLTRLVVRYIARVLGKSTPRSENSPFALIMDENIRRAHGMYLQQDACALLRAILLRFKHLAEARGHLPVLAIMPQLMDISLSRGTTPAYRKFYEGLKHEMAIIDMTDVVAAVPPHIAYIDDQYGGHLSQQGNELAATHIEAELKRLLPSGFLD
jgi:hypothetical protein